MVFLITIVNQYGRSLSLISVILDGLVALMASGRLGSSLGIEGRMASAGETRCMLVLTVPRFFIGLKFERLHRDCLLRLLRRCND